MGKLPSQDVLRKLLDYDPATGELRWKPRGIQDWDTKHAGRPALQNVHSGNGYLRGTLLGKSVVSHRVIMKYMTGEDPLEVDHINGIRHDNWWLNLRNVTPGENGKNKSIRSDNKSGYVGISKVKSMWHVFIGKRPDFVGSFHTLEEAISARKKAEALRGYHGNYGRAPTEMLISSQPYYRRTA